MKLPDRLEKISRPMLAVAVGMLLLIYFFYIVFLDDALDGARSYVAGVPEVVSKIGPVKDTTLYRVRYGGGGGCFARYFFYVHGEDGQRVDGSVHACGDRGAPRFSWQDHNDPWSNPTKAPGIASPAQ
jgi:hypothetical protein